MRMQGRNSNFVSPTYFFGAAAHNAGRPHSREVLTGAVPKSEREHPTQNGGAVVSAQHGLMQGVTRYKWCTLRVRIKYFDPKQSF